MRLLRWLFNCWVPGEFYYHVTEWHEHKPFQTARRRARTGEIWILPERALTWEERKRVPERDWCYVGSAHGIFNEFVSPGKTHFQ